MISREQAIATLKRTWRTEELKFYAEFFRPKKEDGSLIKPRPGVNAFGFFRNLSINDRKIFYPPDEVLKYERNISFKVDVVKGLEDGKYYYLELELENEEKRKENPYALKIKDVYILEEDHLSPREFINQWFYKKGHTPGDASTIAGQLTLNELELYTHTKRFIFELIQNADDMPDGNKDVNIEIILLPNHLLFLHNGKYFDREDVKAISDAAKSTKSKSLSQTGYKGIGFKSVFTDSTRVYIKSGDYFFKFDKLEPIFKDFYRLYKGYSDNLTPKARKEFEIEYKGREQVYTIIDKIPWQIKPIWVEPGTVPQELSSSPFVKNRQVSIALEISQNILRQKDYHGMILGLLREPRFLLFLRNTKGFRYSNISDQSSESIIDISVREKNDIISVYSNALLIASYIKHEFTISITNEDFIKAGLNFQKKEMEGGKIEFFDNNGNKLDNIPEKLGRLDNTVITLSAKMDKYAIEKLYKEDSILFNYLPTSDQRFGFPFLVNADFVSKSDREFIQIENKWNHYIFYHLGQKCIEWIAILANVFHVIEGKKLFSYATTYLNLLPDALLDEDNEELTSINIAYNKGLTDAILLTSFVIDNNRNLKKCDEIILDDTSISRVLGNNFFKEFTRTHKELPFFMLDLNSLKKDYLNIEIYEAETLITEFATETNKQLLTKTLTSLKTEKYLDFLAWLDSFCNNNDVDNDWLLDLPIIKFNESVISLRESIANTEFYFRLTRTKELEPILNKSGFTLSDFNIDDEKFNYLKAIVLQQDSYLKTELKLYEHIASAKYLSKLTATEKNTLIIFFESLVDVGPAKYAKALPLFKSKKQSGTLMPLNSLISNNCTGLPAWLSDFVIDAAEEKALSIIFQNQLLKEKDLLENLFCNADIYSTLIANINTKNIDEFYAFLLKLHKAKPDDVNIDFSNIPLVFIESSSSFVFASSVFWPESITKLPANKYDSVRSIIENITHEKLPHYLALQIKAPFALGGKDFKITKITPIDNSFKINTLNDFLDWAEDNIEYDLLNNFSFIQIEENFTVAKMYDTFTYYTTDENLIALIEASALNLKLNILPHELYSIERSKIGLLEGSSLLKHLIENGLSTPELARYIQSANDPQLCIQYLEQLTELNIDSSKSYSTEDAEFKILKMVASHIIDDVAKLDIFRDKINLEGVKLLEKAVSADVKMFDAENKFIYQFQNIELSDILPGYKGKTYPVSEIVELFINFRDAEGIRKIFKAKGRSTKKIYLELLELKLQTYNAAQTLFLSYYQSLYPTEAVLKDKIFFTIDSEIYSEAYKKELHLFLDYCLKENNYIAFVAQGILASFNPINLVATEEYAIEVEKLPMWLSEWVNKSESDTKKAYLKLIGINDESSPIVLYRKAIKEAEVEPMSVNCALINNDLLLINTLLWLSVQNTVNGFNLKKDVLQPLYLKLLNRKVTIDTLLIPALENYQDDSYLLQSMKEGDDLHYMNEGWGEYKETIFSELKSTKWIIDDVLPKAYRDTLKVIEKPFEKMSDNENMVSKSKSFDEEYYQEWNLKSQYNIQIYDGTQLPYLIKYNGILINTIKDKYADCIGNVYYVVESKKESILFYLEGILPESALNALKLHKQNLIEKEKEAEKKIQFTEEESAVWKKLFGNEIPEAYYQDINLAACVSALVALDKTGYDVSKAEVNLSNSHLFAQITPVYKNDSNEKLTIMCRSAIGGILYLTAQAWERLGSNDIHLFVKTGQKENNYHLFHEKNDVLEISDTKYQVFRVEASSNSLTTDEILSGVFAKDKIWLILKMKENGKYKSIFEGGIKRNEENPDYENINTAENSNY